MIKRKVSHLKPPAPRSYIWLIAIALLCCLFVFSASADGQNCTLITPERGQIGKTIKVQYSIQGGSGNYTDIGVSVSPMLEMSGTGQGYGSAISSNLESSEGEYEFVAPVATLVWVGIYWKDASTGQEFNVDRSIYLDSNPDYPISFSFDKDEYTLGDAITVNYSISGITELKNAKIWWGWGKGSSWPDFNYNVEEIHSSNGQSTFTPMYGTYAVFYLSGEDGNGNPFFKQSDPMYLREITDELIIKLPASLTNIESEAFSNTAFIGVEIPDGIVYIADDAFANSNVRILVSGSDYVRQYALSHDILFREK